MESANKPWGNAPTSSTGYNHQLFVDYPESAKWQREVELRAKSGEPFNPPQHYRLPGSVEGSVRKESSSTEFVSRLRTEIPKIRVSAAYTVFFTSWSTTDEEKQALADKCQREGLYAGYRAGPKQSDLEIDVESWSHTGFKLVVSWGQCACDDPHGSFNFTQDVKFRAVLEGFLDASHTWRVNFKEVVDERVGLYLNPTPLDRFGFDIHELKTRMGPDKPSMQAKLLESILDTANDML